MAQTPKPVLKSRTVALLTTVTTVVLVRWIGKVLPSDVAHEIASHITDEVVALLVALATAAVVKFKKQDYAALHELLQSASAPAAEDAAKPKKKKTVGEILADKKP